MTKLKQKEKSGGSVTYPNESTTTVADFASLADVISGVADLDAFRQAAWTSWGVASNYWRAPMESRHLPARMKELVLLAMHASVTSLNAEAVERHIKRARAAGATAGEIIDVLITIVAVANHALYFSIPVLQDELGKRGDQAERLAELDPTLEAAKRAFIKSRGFWNADREAIARLMPEYYDALDAVSTESWDNGPLSTKERAFICIGIDCTVTHKYEPGLRRHIRNALDLGATGDEILEIFQLSGLLGLESYILGAKILSGR
ncbi:carboxymuconolactone decarboxylase family protein [Arthrobacter sp. FW305-BF8]|uniref:carboxymuconolactone decarboxylase family protein n=1 Tax=Arthrobacter sp. FW305-BF8 TaxID=2879617 RepID=UPI001F463502|nr:carboxymuconolactone decarboxylase family protein [Arthrobacter sp. FW305-BF8]UKA55187.1 carboxymuconolactone decarboxylase family protein [Arthrobacter sp. FW305-BF8]